jgi:hypothetical protein
MVNKLPSTTTSELTEKQHNFLHALFGPAAGDFREAMRIAGYSDATTVKEVITPLRQEILEHAQSFLSAHSPKAIMKLVSMLDNPNQPGASNLLKTIQMIVDRVGLTEKREELNISVPSGGIFILPAKEAQEFVRYDNAKVIDLEVEATDQED